MRHQATHVIDCDDQRPARGQRAKHVQEPGSDRKTFRRLTGEFGTQQRRL